MSIKGFSLIEAMVVLGIFAIMMTIALPSFVPQYTKAQITESLAIIDGYKQPIIDYYRFRGEFPKDNEAVGMPKPEKILGNYVKKVTLESGVLNIYLGNKINKSVAGAIVSIQPLTVIDSADSPMSWGCGHATVPEGMEANGENKTSVEKKYLPSKCAF